MFRKNHLLAAVLAGCSITAAAQAQAQDGGLSPISSYPAAFFAKSQPYSALDMVGLLPGFALESGNAEVRGYSGSGGNVLIDGARPASKQETLDDMLRRIPAGTVDRIELIRGGAGIDMQGHGAIANIVLVKTTSLRGRAEGGAYAFRSGLVSPRLGGELALRSGNRLIEAAAAVYREYDDEHGRGPRNRMSPGGTILRDADYHQDEGRQVAEISGGLQDRLLGGMLRANGSFRMSRQFADIEERIHFPVAGREPVFERERKNEGEFSLRYERSIGTRGHLELLALQRLSGERAHDTASDGPDSSITRTAADTRETILRAALRRSAGAWSIEAGVEAALNSLESENRLEENGANIPLPAADVRIEERRAEPFLTASWRISPALSLESGLRLESSTLVQSGDSSLRKSLSFLKPRAMLNWSVGRRDQLRLLVEREVGQLDFANFVSSSSLANGTVTAGNPDLEPDRTWGGEVAWEHGFWGNGSLVLSARREWIGDLVDRLPVAGPDGYFDAVGNIGHARRFELAMDLTLPLDRIGLTGVMVKGKLTRRLGRVEDPATGTGRRISGDVPTEGEFHVSHDLPRRHARWGIDIVLPVSEPQYRFDEVRTDRIGARIGVFAEYRPSPAWNFRLYAKNLTGSAKARERIVFDGLRGEAGRDYIETRSLRVGPYIGFSIQRSFGGGK